MSMTASWHTSILLHDGRVLVAGGNGTPELYSPQTGTFTLTAKPSWGVLIGQSQTLLADGRVLFAGGADGNPASTPAVRAAEIYTP
jgi:hypothetical protein